MDQLYSGFADKIQRKSEADADFSSVAPSFEKSYISMAHEGLAEFCRKTRVLTAVERASRFQCCEEA